MTDDLNLTCTNADIWTATQPYLDENGKSQRPFANVVAVPIKAYGAMNRTALVKAVESAMAEINAARIACCETHGTKSEDGTRYEFATPDAEAACNAEFVEILNTSRTLTGVQPIKLSDMRPDAFLAHEDIARCGPLLVA